MGGSPNTSKMTFLGPIPASSLDIPVGKNGLNCFYSPNIGTTKVNSRLPAKDCSHWHPTKTITNICCKGVGQTSFLGTNEGVHFFYDPAGTFEGEFAAHWSRSLRIPPRHSNLFPHLTCCYCLAVVRHQALNIQLVVVRHHPPPFLRSFAARAPSSCDKKRKLGRQYGFCAQNQEFHRRRYVRIPFYSGRNLAIPKFFWNTAQERLI